MLQEAPSRKTPKENGLGVLVAQGSHQHIDEAEWEFCFGEQWKLGCLG